MKKIYTPVDLCPIGVNKGEKLYLVYKYAPDYLQWLISKEIIKVDISEFSKLPNPTPIPVSYTHLDVYKRQALKNITRNWPLREKY